MHLRLCFAVLALALSGASAQAEGSYLRYLPSSSRAVYVVNVSALGDTEKKLSETLVRQLYATQFVPELKKLDSIPVTDLKQIVVAQSYFGEVDGVVLIRGKVDAALLDKQMREAAKQSKDVKIDSLGKPAAAVFSRKVNHKALEETFPFLGRLFDNEVLPKTLRTMILPSTAYVAALDDETLIVSLSGRVVVERALRARPAKTAPRISDDLKKLLESADEKDVMNVVLGEDCLSPKLKLALPDVLSDWFSYFENALFRIKGGKKVTVTANAACKTKADAEKMEKATAKASKTLVEVLSKTLSENQQKVAKALIEAVKVTRKDAVLTLTGEISEEDAKKLLPPEPEKK